MTDTIKKFGYWVTRLRRSIEEFRSEEKSRKENKKSAKVISYLSKSEDDETDLIIESTERFIESNRH